MNWRGVPFLALAGAGCSLLVPLDYTGGKEPVPVVNQGGSAAVDGGTGGTTIVGDEGGRSDTPNAGTGAESDAGMGGVPGAAGEGTGGEQITGAGGSTAGGGGTGAVTGAGGRSGDVSGSGADGGTGGTANPAGGGGLSGGGSDTGGISGGGENGGTSGGGMAGAAGCNFELDKDPMHCGSCTNACADGVECEDGQCVTAPCVGICDPASIVPLTPNDGYRMENIPKGGGCYNVPKYTPNSGAPGIVCWNFGSRSLEVNATTTPCTAGNGTPLSMGTRAGGYCMKVGPATDTCSPVCGPGFVLPLSSSLSAR